MPYAPMRGHVLPAQLIELSEVDGKPCSWMQTAKTGNFISTRYGRFKLTTTDLKQAERNINEAGPDTIPVDYDHLMMHVAKPGDGVAAGWFQRSETRNEGKELWGLIEWTPRAAEHIRNREYRYCSPVILRDYVDNETEEKKGTTILCAAITNTPFLKGMAPLQLSGTNELLLAETSLTERQQRISSAFYEKYSGKYSLNGEYDMPYIVDYFEDYVICRREGKLWKLAYTIDDELNVSFPSEPVEVVVNYAELSETQNMPDTKPTESSELLKLREDYANLDGVVKALSSRLETSERTAEEEKNRRIALENQIKKTNADALVLSLIQGGKLPKKQQDWAQKYALNDPEGFGEFVKNLDPVVKLNTEHGSGEADEQVEQGRDPVVQLNELCNDYIKNHGGPDKVKFGDAMRAVGADHPELVMRYREAFVSSGTPGVN